MLFIIMLTASTFMLSGLTQSANTSTAWSQQLQHLGATYKGHVASAYGVSGGYWQLEVNYTYPDVTFIAKTRYHAANTSCWQLASQNTEPLSDSYRPTRQPPTVCID